MKSDTNFPATPSSAATRSRGSASLREEGLMMLSGAVGNTEVISCSRVKRLVNEAKKLYIMAINTGFTPKS